MQSYSFASASGIDGCCLELQCHTFLILTFVWIGVCARMCVDVLRTKQRDCEWESASESWTGRWGLSSRGPYLSRQHVCYYFIGVGSVKLSWTPDTSSHVRSCKGELNWLPLSQMQCHSCTIKKKKNMNTINIWMSILLLWLFQVTQGFLDVHVFFVLI
jgi:hypothetical protein